VRRGGIWERNGEKSSKGLADWVQSIPCKYAESQTSPDLYASSDSKDTVNTLSYTDQTAQASSHNTPAGKGHFHGIYPPLSETD